MHFKPPGVTKGINIVTSVNMLLDNKETFANANFKLVQAERKVIEAYTLYWSFRWQ